MKKYTTILAIAILSLFVSCVKDLDTLPLNETDFTSEKAYENAESYLKGLAYINAYWAFVSQNDAGSSDIEVENAGQSELCRQYMILNELTTDELKTWWGDGYSNPLQYHSWSDAPNNAMVAVYTRCMKGIALVNEFLLQTTDAKLEARGHSSYKAEVAGYRAEARFHRAMFYYLMMDFFGNPPFALEENIGGAVPKQIKRADLYEWIEGQLLDLVADGSDMPSYGEVPYPRPTKGSAMALLARMYLNAEVYTGTPQWQKAKDAADAVCRMGYRIHDNYQELFLEDNTTNGAAEEMIFAIEYDKDHAQSWGGTTHLCSGAFGDNLSKGLPKALGLTGVTAMHPDTWDGYHIPDDLVARFELQGVTWGGGDGTFGYDRASSDKRAFFYNGNQTQDFGTNTDTSGGWLCWKWVNMDSKGNIRNSETVNFKFSSADFPVFRLAEMYLIYAEADARLSGGTVTDPVAIARIKELRDRAGVATPASMDLDWLLDERVRELLWEGHRRVDLIRYGYFTSASFPWTYKGGVKEGNVELDSYRTVFPIIPSDLIANPNLTQNEGYKQ